MNILGFNKTPFPEYKRVILNTLNGHAFDGVYTGLKNNYVILKQTKMLTDKEVTTIDGDVLIPVNQVDFIQVI